MARTNPGSPSVTRTVRGEYAIQLSAPRTAVYDFRPPRGNPIVLAYRTEQWQYAFRWHCKAERIIEHGSVHGLFLQGVWLDFSVCRRVACNAVN